MKWLTFSDHSIHKFPIVRPEFQYSYYNFIFYFKKMFSEFDQIFSSLASELKLKIANRYTIVIFRFFLHVDHQKALNNIF